MPVTRPITTHPRGITLTRCPFELQIILLFSHLMLDLFPLSCAIPLPSSPAFSISLNISSPFTLILPFFHFLSFLDKDELDAHGKLFKPERGWV